MSIIHSLTPSDVLILSTDRPLSEEQRVKLEKKYSEYFQDNTVVVLPGNLHISILKVGNDV